MGILRLRCALCALQIVVSTASSALLLKDGSICVDVEMPETAWLDALRLSPTWATDDNEVRLQGCGRNVVALLFGCTLI